MNLFARLLNESDVGAPQEPLESQPEYAEQLTGFPPGASGALNSLVADEPGLERLQIGLISTTAGASEPFWVAMGYRPTQEKKPYHYARVVGTVRLWERRVRNCSADG